MASGLRAAVLPGRVLDDAGKVVDTAEVTFDLDRDLSELLRSFRITGLRAAPPST